MLELVPAERRGEEFGLYPMHLRLGNWKPPCNDDVAHATCIDLAGSARAVKVPAAGAPRPERRRDDADVDGIILGLPRLRRI